MNWISVGLAAASGALAAMIALLVVPRRGNWRGAYTFVFVVLFVGFSALSEQFLGPRLSLPWEMKRAEQALLQVPAYQAMKQYDPQTYTAIMDDLRRGLEGGKTQKDLIAQIKPRVEQLVQKRMPVASDQAVVDYMGVTVRELRELKRRDPALCFKFMFPQQYGVLNARDYMSKDIIDADFAGLAEVIRTSATAPQPVPAESEVSDDLKAVVTQLHQRHGDDATILQHLQDPHVDQAKGCEITAELYEGILALPQPRSGKLLRYMLSQI